MSRSFDPDTTGNRGSGRIWGLMAGLIDPLPWDTDFCGIPIGRVSLDGADAERLKAIDAQAREMGIVCLYGGLAPTDDKANRWAQRFGHRLVEVALTFDRPEGSFTPRPSSSTARLERSMKCPTSNPLSVAPPQ